MVRTIRRRAAPLVAPVLLVCAAAVAPATATTPATATSPARGSEAPPPRNPFLADSVYALGHVDSAQQDSVAVAGPAGPSRTLDASERRFVFTGPAHFGAYVSGPYADGRRVVWSNGVDRIVKLDHDTWAVLAERPVPGVERTTREQAERSIARWDASNEGVGALVRGFLEARRLRDLSSVYTVLDRDGVYFMASKDGSITAWGDATPGDPEAPIEALRRFDFPEEVTGFTMGMNVTFDGWIVVATEHGWVMAVSRDLTTHHAVRMRHAEGAEQKATRPVGYGWVRNGLAIDDAGGVYVASQDHMHKLVWTGERLSTDPADGAWTARYPNGTGEGTGATPSLMGFGDDDRFVVITDGDPLMNVVLFWRDAIPEGWVPPPGATDDRIAGLLPADMGDPERAAIQSEQSVVVAGYGALVVNNEPRNVPWWVPDPAARLYVSYLGSSPRHQPYGVQKFVWNAEARRLERAWVNREVSSPSCVPIVSRSSGLVYLIGARENRWTLEALDWQSGASDFHWVIGGQRFNPLFSGTLLDQAGRVHYGVPWGRVRLEPR